MMVFRRMAQRDWEKNDPGRVAELKKSGIYEEELDRVAEQAGRELAHLVNAGSNYEAARELVIRQYLLTPEETSE